MEISVIFKIAGIGLITAVLNIILKKSDKDEIATFITIGGLILVLLMIVDMIGGLFDNLKNILGVY
ncbi:MAG: stage III sporulation protein AC [Eubacteriales bacterium]|nr:stage III sporulation protein AC [Eubacteriales bacterium]